jgi:hypothetical protein
MRRSRLVVGLAAVAAATVLAPTAAHAVSNPPGGGSSSMGRSLSRGDTLYAGAYIEEPNFYSGNLMTLVMQDDGNLVEYVADDPQGDGPWRACWASGTYGSGADQASYQQDGNFVVYTPSGHAVWASNTQWGGGTTVDINRFGVVYVGTTPITTTCG